MNRKNRRVSIAKKAGARQRNLGRAATYPVPKVVGGGAEVNQNGAKATSDYDSPDTLTAELEASAESISLSVLIVFDADQIGTGAQAEGQWQLWTEMAASGVSCQIVSWISSRPEDRMAWLAARGITLETTQSATAQPFASPGRELLHLSYKGVQFLGSASGPDSFEEPRVIAELVRGAIDYFQPDAVICHGVQAPMVLDTARRMGVFTALLLANDLPRDPGTLRAANVVIAPSRFAAEYLRDAFSLPAAFLPPPICESQLPILSSQGGSRLVFDASAPANGLSIFVQIAEELGRRRPNLPITICGESSVIAASAEAILKQAHPLDRLDKATSLLQSFETARVLIAPALNWESVPFSSLAAMCRGIPAVVSDLPGFRELSVVCQVPGACQVRQAVHSAARGREVYPVPRVGV
jgi:hypothetical protein